MGDHPESFGNGRYNVVRVLGEGGQAITYEAVDKLLGRLVAIKAFHVRHATSWKEVELAEREARVLASLSHPSIPRYIDHFEQDGSLCIVTEKIDGLSLSELKMRGDFADESSAISLLREAARTLDYIHGQHPPIIHRDIKPSNVIRRPDGSFAFVDFGSVRERLKQEAGSTVVGTFGYMAPEQFQGRAMPASDVYAVGATVVSWLSGTEPEALPHHGLAIDVKASLATCPVGPELVQLLEAMLRPDPDERVSNLTEAIANRRLGAGKPQGSASFSSDAQRDPVEQGKQSARDSSGLAPIIPALLIVGLFVLQVATSVLLRVVIPVILHILAIVFGEGLRKASRAMGRIADETERAFAQARRSVWRDPELGSPQSSARQKRRDERIRVSAKPSQQPSGDAEQDQAAPSHEDDETKRGAGAS